MQYKSHLELEFSSIYFYQKQQFPLAAAYGLEACSFLRK